MQTIENTKVAGKLKIVLTGPDGQIKKEATVDNLVVNSGLAFIASRMTGTGKNVMSHMALGSGTTSADAGDTGLQSMLGSRKALDSTTISGADNEQVVYVATFDPGEGTGAVTEAGIFNAASSGDMLCRTTFPVVTKQADDTMSITWTITLTAD